MTALARTAVEAYVEYDGKTLKLFLYSRELPPFISVGGAKASSIMKILSNKFGSYLDNGVEIAKIAPIHVPAVLVWIAASIASKPSSHLLQALIDSTPRSAVDLLFELTDAHTGYRKNKPLIPYRKLHQASRIVLKILKLHKYPVDA